MENFQVYRDIQARTGGDIYIGVVGPVRTGKSTFIRRFMELVALPQMSDTKQAEIRDQLPLSGSGKIITTAETKFIPKEAVPITLGEDQQVKIRLIDSVGFLVKGASGQTEDGKERMVKTPWFEQAIPFREAARIGTQKVIQEHSTIGIVVTTDGSFGELPRDNFPEAEEKTIQELKKQQKPFIVLVNSQMPYKDAALKTAEEIQQKYKVTALTVNCDQLRKEDIARILEKVLYEFPVSQIQFFIPKWVEMLPVTHKIKQDLLEHIQKILEHLEEIRDAAALTGRPESPYIKDWYVEQIQMDTGCVIIQIHMYEKYYYEMLSDLTGTQISGEYDLIHTVRNLAMLQKEYESVKDALASVKMKGYGVVSATREEIRLDDPVVIRQGNKYGVKIRSEAPSIHMIRANIETDIAPIVGSEQQAKDLVNYINEAAKSPDGVWGTNIFGKSIEELVMDGVRNKIAMIGDESQAKLQDTMQKIVNDSNGGMVCIII